MKISYNIEKDKSNHIRSYFKIAENEYKKAGNSNSKIIKN